MWRYVHTDEMYHSLTNKNELYHSNTYLGQDYSDGIKHFKYISKKMVNGKWQYIYAHKTGKNTYSFYNKTKGKAGSKYGTYEKTGMQGNPNEKHTVKKGNRLFTKTRTTGASWDKNNKMTVEKTTEVGLARQGVDAAKAKLKKAKKKGKKAISKALNRKKKK